MEPDENSTDFLFGSNLEGNFDKILSLFPCIISDFIGEYCFLTSYLDSTPSLVKGTAFSNPFTVFQIYVDCMYEGHFRRSEKEVQYGASNHSDSSNER